MNKEFNRFLDIGGGPEWNPQIGHGEWLLKNMRSLRVLREARGHPDNAYVVLDLYIPRAEANIIHAEQPNVHFVEYKLNKTYSLPFSDGSIDKIEMNHMWTPLSEDPYVYYNVLMESWRVLVSGGILSITEKVDRLSKVRLTLRGISEYRLKTHSITEVTDPDRSEYTKLAMMAGVKVNTLELKKGI